MVNRLIQRINLAAQVLVNGRLATAEEFDIPEINPEEVAEAKTFFPMEKFFIFGHARSGTTLLTRLIRLHPKVHCNYQAHFFTRVRTRWYFHFDNAVWGRYFYRATEGCFPGCYRQVKINVVAFDMIEAVWFEFDFKV